MTRWKLTRLLYGKEEFFFKSGDEATLGRGVRNTIAISSIVISRNHCTIKFEENEVIITDLKSSNGIYVGSKKITPNTPFVIKDSDIIGIGWTNGLILTNIKDQEKYIFQLTKETPSPLKDRIKFQSDVKAEMAEMLETKPNISEIAAAHSPVLSVKPPMKRKIDEPTNLVINEKPKILPEITDSNEVIDLLSDSEPELACKKPKLDPDKKPSAATNIKDLIKLENDDFDPDTKLSAATSIKDHIKLENDDYFDPFKVKQESLFDDDPIQIESDDDDESVQWLIRLSQSSPGKPFIKIRGDCKQEHEDSSYSQMDDYEDDIDYMNNSISRPPPTNDGKINQDQNKISKPSFEFDEADDILDDPISLIPNENTNIPQTNVNDNRDEIDGVFRSPKMLKTDSLITPEDQSSNKKINHLVKSTIMLKADLSSATEDQSTNDKISDVVNPPKVLEADFLNNIYDNCSNEKINSAVKSPTILEADVLTTTAEQSSNDKNKRAQMIVPREMSRSKSSRVKHETQHKSERYKHSKDKRKSTSKTSISESQKEERRKKLKDIATKKKEEQIHTTDTSITGSSKDKTLVNAKVTRNNRGAFLTDNNEGSRPIHKKESSKVCNNKDKSQKTSPNEISKNELKIDNIENKKKKSNKSIDDLKKPKNKNHSRSKSSSTQSEKLDREPLKNLKPSESKVSNAEKDSTKSAECKVSTSEKRRISHVKPKKTVRFSDAPPVVHVFEIADGNSLKSTSSVKTSVDVQQGPIFSLEKITLMKILRWNPQWLEEQFEPDKGAPPILGHSNIPMTIFHSFKDHYQYVQLVGDLLLMEIWEYLTQGFMRLRNKTPGIAMRIAALPPAPAADRFELFNISVDVSVPTTEFKTVPRIGDIILVEFGPENNRIKRFFFVHNVRCLPSPPNNVHSFFNISLHSCYTGAMRRLKPGEVVMGVSLAYIQNELSLFTAMEHLATSPLAEAILRPHPMHFPIYRQPSYKNGLSKWTRDLNPSQLDAVHSSVTAALSDRPSIQMVQGPPGTGKSSVICAIVMSYFYDIQGRRQPNRGKVLICATSNAAVDELVCKLLQIRQKLPKEDRFRMVRVGRVDAMHPRAREISSQHLAQRDAAARLADQATLGFDDEISHLEAKINMWKTQEQNSKDPERAAYCRGRVNYFINKINLIRGGGGGSSNMSCTASAEQLADAERRIIEGAHIIVTTLTSALHHKMKGLKRRIALCIVDEAGQAIEPESLIPLTLDVTRMTLIGDPQQLPGFIVSQRAKKHGLSESLFGRLASCAESWNTGSGDGGSVSGNDAGVVLLRRQYRMQVEIAEYPNRAFYGGVVEHAPPPRPAMPLALPAYCMLAISSGDKAQGASGANEMEAWGVTRVVLALSSALRSMNLTLAVITPYNSQKDLIKKYLRVLQDPTDGNVEVNSVDSFQGQERDVVVVSLARSSGVGFLTDTGRMNVMLTRAKHALLVVLNPHAIIKNHQWRTLVEDAQKRNLYRSLPTNLCQGPAAGQIPHSEILKHITHQTPGYK